MGTEQEALVFLPCHWDGLGALDSFVVPSLWTWKDSFNYLLPPHYSENIAEDPV